ncbi:MAG: hypothetical protein K2K46_01970 [Lachnospiraceae bacterium]|nr:hypothetical protein [Lachnospiraceae bacterium]
MKEILVENTNNKICVALSEDGATFCQKVCIWYEKGKRKSKSVVYDRNDIMKPNADKLNEIISSWGIDYVYQDIKNQIMNYVDNCPESEIEIEGSGYDVNELFIYLAEIGKIKLRGSKDDSYKSEDVIEEDEYIYFETNFFKSMTSELAENGYSYKDIIRELKQAGFLRTNKKRNTYQKHVKGKLIRYICIDKGMFDRVEDREENELW